MGIMPSDIVGNRVQLRRSINVYGELTAGKNENSIRAFTMSLTAQNIINDQLAQCNGLYVFGIISESNYRKRWKVYCEANGIPYISPYEMRHTFVSVIQGLPEGSVKAVVGHSRNMDTFGIYGHEVSGIHGQIATKIEDIFRDILTGLPE